LDGYVAIMQSYGIYRHGDVEEEFCPFTVGSSGTCKRQQCCLSFRNTALRGNKADMQHAELVDLRSDAFVSSSFN